MQHTSSRGHPACRNDHRRIAQTIKFARIFDRAYHFGHLEHPCAFLGTQAVLQTMAVVNLGHVDGHRTVQINRNVRYDASLLQSVQCQQEFLSPSNCEGWYDDNATTGDCAADDAPEFVIRIDPFVQTIPVSRLDHEVIRPFDCCRRKHDAIMGTPKIPGKQHGLACRRDFGRSGTQNMPCRSNPG